MDEIENTIATTTPALTVWSPQTSRTAAALTRDKVMVLAASYTKEIREAVRARCRDEIAVRAAAADVVFRLQCRLDYTTQPPDLQRRMREHFRWRAPDAVPVFGTAEDLKRYLVATASRVGCEYRRDASLRMGPVPVAGCPRRREGRTLVAREVARIRDPFQELQVVGGADIIDVLAQDVARFSGQALALPPVPVQPDHRLDARASRRLDVQRQRRIVRLVQALNPSDRVRVQLEAVRERRGAPAGTNWRQRKRRARDRLLRDLAARGITGTRRIPDRLR